jgi:hypothetical protein
MAIDDFSAIIELAATLSIAFVAVEYIKSFTHALCEKFFDYETFIEEAFGRCLSLLPDRATLNHIEPITIDGKSTNTRIEKVKRKNEALIEKIAEQKDNMKVEFSQQCQTFSMSSICFCIFVINTILLFLGGVENMMSYNVHLCVIFLSVFFCLYLITCWFLGEKYTFFSSLKYAGLSMLGIVLLSFVLILLFHDKLCCCMIQSYWHWGLVLIVLLSFFNFGVFTFKIWLKSKQIKNNIEVAVTNLEKECQDQQKDVNELMNVVNFSLKLQFD